MRKTAKKSTYDFEKIEKVLKHQKYPCETVKYLKYIARDIGENGLIWVLIKVYCLGVIDGKQEVRRRKSA